MVVPFWGLVIGGSSVPWTGQMGWHHSGDQSMGAGLISVDWLVGVAVFCRSVSRNGTIMCNDQWENLNSVY